jgi:gluconokinase
MVSAIEHLVVMGVSGAGKTTMAEMLATQLERPFVDADDLHPAANIAKMSVGRPLNSSDRKPWLEAVRSWMSLRAAAGQSTVVACSALRQSYRDTLRRGVGDVIFIHLTADRSAIAERLDGRNGHFMPASLIASQFADLEHLTASECGMNIDVLGSPSAVLHRIIGSLDTVRAGARSAPPRMLAPATKHSGAK